MIRFQNGLLTIALAGCACATAAGQDITSNLIGHWKLTEASGTTANDSSSSAKHGTYNGGVSLAASAAVPGHGAIAAQFDGVNDYVGIPSESTYDLTGAMTAAIWIKVDVFDVQWQAILGKGDSAWRILRDSTNNGVRFHVSGLTTGSCPSTVSMLDGKWHHVVGVYTGSQLQIYIDGQLSNAVSTSGSITTNNYPVEIGRNAEAAGREFDGALYDARVYNRALSSSDIAYLYLLGTPLAHWKFDEGSGTTLADSSVSGSSAAAFSSSAPGWITGVRKKALSFDGVDDAADTNANFTPPATGTVAFWFRPAAIPTSRRRFFGLGGDWEAWWDTDGIIRFDIGVDGTTAGFQTSTAFTQAGRWYHVAAVFNQSTGAFQVFVDGVLNQSGTATFTTQAAALLTFGTRTGSTERYAGELDDFRIYNRTLSAAEVAELYGFLGHWKLTETSGATAADSSPRANNGTYANGVTLNATGPFPGTGSKAADFDGSDDYVTVPNESTYDITETITVAAWIKVDAFSVQWPTVVSKGGSIWRLSRGQSPNANAMHFACNGLSNPYVYGTIDVNNGHWHHVVGVYDGSTLSLYVDGVLDVSTASTGSISTNDEPVRIGDNSAYSDRRWDGRIHDVRVYNRALTATEIAEIYGLIGHWKFNEGSGSTLADSSLRAGNAAFNVGSPAWTDAVYGKGLAFSGANDAITSASFVPPTTGTLAFWMRPSGVPATVQRPLGLGGDWEVRHDPSGLLFFDLGATAAGGGFTTASAPTTAGSWYHVVAMYDTSDESYSVYLNGILERSGISGAALAAQSAAQLSFGTRTGATERFAGALDDVRVYNRKLSPWEVYQIYGLMAWYKLDETSGTVAVDSTGRGQDGTFVGSPTLNATANGATTQGTAVAFNGSNYVQAPGLYNRPTSVSASAWLCLDAADSSGAEVISLGDYFLLRVDSGATGAVAKYYNGSSWVTASANQVILNTGWHHFTAVLDSGTTLTLYVDGVAASTVAGSGISYSGLGSNTRIATHGNSGSTYDLTGRIDDVRVFDRALTAGEAYKLYRGSRINGLKITKWVESR